MSYPTTVEYEIFVTCETVDVSMLKVKHLTDTEVVALPPGFEPGTIRLTVGRSMEEYVVPLGFEPRTPGM